MTRLAIACAFALLGIVTMLIYLITERPKKAAPTFDFLAMVIYQITERHKKAAPPFDCPYRHDSRCPRVEDE